MASAAEAEIGALFLNAQLTAPLRTTLIELHHRQPPTLIRTDNAVGYGFANRFIKQKRSKAINMFLLDTRPSRNAKYKCVLDGKIY